MSLKPVILIGCGSWHIPAHYQPVIDKLTSRGYEVVCPRHTTNSGATPPAQLGSFEADIQQFRDIALAFLKAGRDIIALLHSHGGIVGTRALSGLGKTDNNRLGRVLQLVYVCAMVPPQDQPLEDMFDGKGPSALPWLDFSTPGMIACNNGVADAFYNDLTAEQQKLALSMLVPMPISILMEAYQGTGDLEPAWHSIPSTYVFTTLDQTLHLPFQQTMANRLESDLQKRGKSLDKETIEASHSPCVSKPDAIAEIVDRAWQKQIRTNPADGPGASVPVESVA